MKKPRMLVDVDGVLLDFLARALEVISQMIGRPYTIEQMEGWDLWDGLSKEEREKYEDAFYVEIKKPGFCRGLPMYAGSQEGLARLQAISEVYIVTSPMGDHPTWTHERDNALHAHFNIPTKKIVHTSAKYLCVGDGLVDDKPLNIEEWLEAHPGGLAMLWDQPYNRSANIPGAIRVKSWDDVIAALAAWQDIPWMLEPGVYRHFKGAKYRVHRVLRNATNAASYGPMVYYEAVDKSLVHDHDDGLEIEPGHYVRDYHEFVSKVQWPNGQMLPRWQKEY